MSNQACCFSKLSLGIAFGATVATYMLLMNIAFHLWGWGDQFIPLLSTLYIGYDTTMMGTLIGMGWGFLEGFIFGFLVAFFHSLAKCCCDKSCNKDSSS